MTDHSEAVGSVSLTDPVIAIIGAGVMGETFIGGLVRAGTSPDRIVICEHSAARRDAVCEEYRVTAMDVEQAATVADVALIAVKPGDARPVLRAMGPHLRGGSLLMSIAAGVSTATMESMVAAGVSCIRAMPNTPAVIGEGMTAISAGAHASPAGVELAGDLLSVLGEVVEVDEHLQDAVTAISGSGPAYVFAFMEALEAAGIGLGLDPQVARALVLQTVAGAGQLARSGDVEPAELRRRVTSPAGTTQAALEVLIGDALTGGDLAALIERATRAARDRSIELGRPASEQHTSDRAEPGAGG